MSEYISLVCSEVDRKEVLCFTIRARYTVPIDEERDIETYNT